MKYTYLILVFFVVSLLSCGLDSYATPGEPIPPQSEAQSVPVPEEGRTVPGADGYFNSYTYIRVYDSGNKMDLLTFGPDKSGVGEFLRYEIQNSTNQLEIDTSWGSYEILSSKIDLYSLYDYNLEIFPSSEPYKDRPGTTVRRNSSPYKGQYAFSLDGTGQTLSFDGADYQRLDQYADQLISDADGGGAAEWDNLGRFVYLNLLLTQAVVPGWGGLMRLTNLVYNLIGDADEDALYGSLYGDGYYEDSWSVPGPLDRANSSIKMTSAHQVLSHIKVDEPTGIQKLAQSLIKMDTDGIGKMWGTLSVTYTDDSGTAHGLVLDFGDNSSNHLVLTDAVVSGFSASAPTISCDNFVTAVNPVDLSFDFMNPGQFTLPLTP